MTALVPDVIRVRAFLRERCGLHRADRLELTYLKMKASGAGGRFLYEARGGPGTHLRVSARHLVTTTESALYSPDLQLLFHVFPADRFLGALPELTDAEAMAPVLGAALLKPGARGATIDELEVRVVRYKPERKCVLRYDLRWSAEAGLPRTVYAKVMRPSELGRTPRLLAGLRASDADVGFELPEPLGILEERHAELYSAVPGTTLSEVCDSDAFPLHCRRTALALRRFHARPPFAGPEEGDVHRDVGQLRRAAEELPLLLPGEADRVGRMGRRLEERIHSMPGRRALVHGDFHADNVLVEGSGVGLVDLDDCAPGDPARDVGSMWAQLTWLSLKDTERKSMREAGRQAFLDAWQAGDEVPTAEPVDAIAAQAALHCVLFAHQCLRHPAAPRRLAQAHGLLEAGEKILDGGLP